MSKSNNQFCSMSTSSEGRPTLTPILAVKQAKTFAASNPHLLSGVKLFISLFNGLMNALI